MPGLWDRRASNPYPICVPGSRYPAPGICAGGYGRFLYRRGARAGDRHRSRRSTLLSPSPCAFNLTIERSAPSRTNQDGDFRVRQRTPRPRPTTTTATCDQGHSGGESVEPVWPHRRLDGLRWLDGEDHEQPHFLQRRCNERANTRTQGE